MTLPADRIQQLHTVATGQDKAELTILHNAVLAQMKIYQTSSTKRNLDDWSAAKEALAKFADQLTARHFPEQAEVTLFPQQKDALVWLKTNNFKVSAGKFSQDVRAGHCQTQTDKSIRLQDLKAYASSLTIDRAKIAASEGTSNRRDEADTRKAEAEAEIKERQNERERREFDAAWVLRETADEETCVWVSRLRDATAYHIGKNLLAIIHGCAGQPSRLAEVQAIVDEALAAAANEISQSGEITVEIE